MSLLDDLNHKYLALHQAKEDSFWSTKMGLSDGKAKAFEESEIRLKEFTTDASWIPKVREALKQSNLNEQERVGLEGWLRFFEVNAMESAEAKSVMNRIVGLESELGRARTQMKLGYMDPKSKELLPASSNRLRMMVITEPEEPMRKAAWEGLRSIEPFALDNGFIEIVKERNRLGRLMGYRNFYDWKVKMFEGFSLEELFTVLDELEANTRDVCRSSVENVAKAKGTETIQPWNFEHATSGDLTAEKDPYLRFGPALLNWGRSFARLGIGYEGARMDLDLVDRKGKFENGFMHGPVPAFFDRDKFVTARINFTANAVPGQVGSGKRALETLFHEGGHAAHFSNIKMPAPCYSQEFAPTSIAFAETQSMFLDSVVGDPDWLTRYAKNDAGNSMPQELIHRSLKEQHEFRAHRLRKLMIVPYFERELYAMSDEQLTAKSILETGRKIETQMVFQPSDSRPILSVPHLLSSDSSAYYHAYVLAQLAVHHTRAFFLERDGRITDNPRLGKDLREAYWKPGNSKSFFQFIQGLTGKPFSAKATVDLVNKPLEKVFAEAATAIEKAKSLPVSNGSVELNANIRMIHGDEMIASNEKASFEEMAATYEHWLRRQEP